MIVNITKVNDKPQVHKIKEFSKRVIVALAIAWFIGLIFGTIVVAIQVWRGDQIINLPELLIYIGAPMTGGLIGYFVKTALENPVKIKYGQNQQSDTNTNIDEIG